MVTRERGFQPHVREQPLSIVFACNPARATASIADSGN
ncbi:hypothetical protein ACVILL_004585 [Bradyrhizobium sp. USDA 3364]